ncbi:fimbrial protein [Serinibacter arcticus]|uniref:Fimbrial protein n=2 Tax=Serinibacter arcticus TaxID=1655435 RepID=A0A2U1ZZW3_9MICO|nr:fimbrial protein [Serinibacter arcticus]
MAATPDAARNGSSTLTVHKYNGAPTDATNDGTELATEPALPGLNGVTFTLERVSVGGAPIDLSTNAGWAAAQALYDTLDTSNPTATQLAAAGATLSGAATATTAGGTATQGAEAQFSGLAFGLYYVTETGFPAGTTPAAPFLVSVPLTDADNTSWLYDVHVYPKNSVVTPPVKTVDDAADVKLGDEIVFTITGDIPDLAADVPIDGYKITDDLDPKVDFVSATATLSNGTALVAGTDYTVTPATATVGGPLVEIVFTDAGRVKLKANADAKVVVTVTTTVNAVGEIVNQATLYPNLPSFTWTPGTPGEPPVSPPVVTKFGGITLNKTNAADDTALAGAKFQVLASSTNDVATATVVTVPNAPTDPAFTGSVWTSGTNGQVVIEGLRYSTWANNAAVAPGQPGYVYYWLVEVEAPADFELLPEPISFVVNSQATAQTVTVENVPSNSGFQLPLTGGVGTSVMYLAGALIVVGGLVLAVRSRRAKA